MPSKNKFKLPKIFLRLLPTIISLSVLAAFLLYQPQLAQDFYQKIKSRLGYSTPTLESHPISAINQFRNQNNLPSLEPHSKLDDAAYYIALNLSSQTATDSPQLDIKKAAQLADYDYQHIAFLTQTSPSPLIQTPEEVWINNEPQTLLDQSFQHIGVSQLELTSPKRLISVIVLASPQNKTFNQNPSPITPTPDYYTGVELWQEIQKYRREHGVPEFKQDNTLCTIASIRVNQLIELGKLDDHQGFNPLIQEYKQQGRIRFNQVAENILYGYPTAQAAIQAWDSSLGHQALMQDGSYVWACAAANHGFAVLIAAF